MISISLNNVSLVLGARRIFSGLNWEVQHDQKLGLIGPNGAGKSSILKLITREFTPEPGGSVVRTRGVSVGYLAQEPQLDPQQSAFEAVLAGNPRYETLRTELQAVETSLADPQVYGHEKRLTRALERQQELLAEYQSLGGDQYTERARSVLLGLG